MGLVARVLRRVHAVVHVPVGVVRGGADVGGRAIAIVEELLVIRLDLLVAARDSRDATAQSLARLLGLVAVVRRVCASIITHNTGLLGDVAEVVRLVPPELLHAAGMVYVGLMVVAACAAAQRSIA